MTFKTVKNSNYIFIFSFFILCFSKGYGQEKTIQGLIILDIENSPADGIFITNSRTQLTSITDITGSFSIRVQAGDILYIRSELYESRQFLLTDYLMTKKMLTIHLNLQPILLEEAVITPKLTGFLDRDVRYSPGKDPLAKLYKNLGFNPDVSNLRDSSSFQFGKDISPLHMNVERIFEAISGDLRRRRNLYIYEGKQIKINKIHSYFGNDYFVQDLKIPKEKISDFIVYSLDIGTISVHYENGNFLSIMMELNRLAPSFLKRLNSWYLPISPTENPEVETEH